MNQSVAAPKNETIPPASTVEDRLSHIETNLAKIGQKLDLPRDENGNLKSSNKGTSKTVLAALFGLGGMKLLGFVSAKFGFVADAARACHKEGLKDGVVNSFKALFAMNETTAIRLPIMLAVGTLGMAAGAVGGLVLGWTRGDRLDSVGDLFKHPGESLKKIFAKEPPQPVLETTSAHPTTTRRSVATVEHHGTVASAPKQHAPTL